MLAGPSGEPGVRTRLVDLPFWAKRARGTPNSWTYEGQTTTVPIHHGLRLICDDLPATMKSSAPKARSSGGEPVDYGYGPMVQLRIPAAGEVQHQPKYRPSYDL